MATKSKSTEKTRRRQATQHEREVLKLAKKRGLINVDLRKPISRYAAQKAREFEPLYGQEVAVVKVPRSEAAKFKGIAKGRGKIVVAKTTASERIRYDPRTREIVGYVGGIRSPIESARKRWRVPVRLGHETRWRSYNRRDKAYEYVHKSTSLKDPEEVWQHTIEEWQDAAGNWHQL